MSLHGTGAMAPLRLGSRGNPPGGLVGEGARVTLILINVPGRDGQDLPLAGLTPKTSGSHLLDVSGALAASGECLRLDDRIGTAALDAGRCAYDVRWEASGEAEPQERTATFEVRAE